MESMPVELKELIDAHGKGSPSCNGCFYSCCFQSGFAIENNVELIYKKYKKGKLKRRDYVFKKDLDYANFVRIYFDAVTFNGNLILYFPRHLAYDNVALIINPHANIDYWSHREQIIKEPANECKGCIFLESSMTLSDQRARMCILHNSEYSGYIYEKPIDCILLSCDQSKKTKKLTSEQERRYFEILQKYYGELNSPTTAST